MEAKEKRVSKFHKRAPHLRTTLPVDQRIDNLEALVKRLHERARSRVSVQLISPVLLTCYLEDQSSTFAYLPIKCKLDSFDVAVDDIPKAGPDDKQEAVVSLKASLLSGASLSYDLPIKIGHFNKSVDLDVDSPAKLTITVNRPVNAWLSIIVYPKLPKREVVKEGEGEGV